MMMSIGHRTGLFDAMATWRQRHGHHDRGRRGLNERYVREWLGAMVTGGIVDYDAARRPYLPAEHAAWPDARVEPEQRRRDGAVDRGARRGRGRGRRRVSHGRGVPYAPTAASMP